MPAEPPASLPIEKPAHEGTIVPPVINVAQTRNSSRIIGSTSHNVFKKLERKIQDDQNPLISKLVTWMDLLVFVGELEDALLDSEDAETLKCHRNIIESVIVLGEFLLDEPEIEDALRVIRCTKKDLQAKITMLRHSDRMWHGDLTKKQADSILAELFDAE